jgi:hypothetical protein
MAERAESCCKNGTSNMPHVPMPTQDRVHGLYDAAPAGIQMFHAAKHMRQLVLASLA